MLCMPDMFLPAPVSPSHSIHVCIPFASAVAGHDGTHVSVNGSSVCSTGADKSAVFWTLCNWCSRHLDNSRLGSGLQAVDVATAAASIFLGMALATAATTFVKVDCVSCVPKCGAASEHGIAARVPRTVAAIAGTDFGLGGGAFFGEGCGLFAS